MLAQNLLRNWRSAITVALVSIPLSLALAVASGATPIQGVITAFWAGLVAGLFGSSHYNITGPTGALSGVLIAYSLTYGYQNLPLVALLSGFLILVSYFLRLDRYIIFIPRSVIHGFTLGVAFIIALGQLDNALGLKGITKTDSILHNTIESLRHISDSNWPIFTLFLVGFLFIFFWNKKFPKLPGAIILSFVGITTAFILRESDHISFELLTLVDKYPNLQPSLFNLSLPNFSLFFDSKLWLVSLATALIAILETLLSGQIANNMTNTKFHRSREVLGLSLANIASGIFGGIPATAALARTALNIKSGATHRASAVLSSVFIGIIVLFFFSVFTLLPLVVIASILVIVSVGMVEKKHFIHLLDNEKHAFILSIIVAIITFAEDPIIGILLGTVAALLIFVQKIALGQTEVLIWKNGKMVESVLRDEFIKRNTIDSDLIVYKISGTLTYINMPAHLEAVEKIRNNKHVIISLRHAFYADTDGIEYLKEIIEVLKQHNQKVLLAGINAEIQKLITKEKFYQSKLVEGKIYPRTSEAIQAILKK